MGMNVKSNFGLHGLLGRKFLVFVSLLFLLILFSSCIVFVFNDGSSFVFGASGKVMVSNEIELTNAIDNAPSGVSVVIALNKDVLTWTLVIPAGKDITLTSSKATGFYKLIGATDQATILLRRESWCLTGLL
jgi:hypothetical protein